MHLVAVDVGLFGRHAPLEVVVGRGVVAECVCHARDERVVGVVVGVGAEEALPVCVLRACELGDVAVAVALHVKDRRHAVGHLAYLREVAALVDLRGCVAERLAVRAHFHVARAGEDVPAVERVVSYLGRVAVARRAAGVACDVAAPVVGVALGDCQRPVAAGLVGRGLGEARGDEQRLAVVDALLDVCVLGLANQTAVGGGRPRLGDEVAGLVSAVVVGLRGQAVWFVAVLRV